jgi:glycosyltransferase involved in cell wall biosynthesis
MCNVAAGLAQRGFDVRVLTDEPLAGDHGHYGALLRDARVPVSSPARSPLSARAALDIPWHLLRVVPFEIRQTIVDLAANLAANLPDVLHCWLDQPNVLGTIAGLLANVPRIVLSTRNANPTNFPRFDFPYLREWYQTAALSDRVRFIANSHSGAVSYAAWLGIPVERFHIVFNGIAFDDFPLSTPEARWKARAEFGLEPSDKVVCGVFRLAAEKQPELFLDVLRRVKERVPNLRVLLAGVGDLSRRVANIVRSRGMGRYVRPLGRRQDVVNVYLASDASLLTSTLEGCPNAVLESQHLGVPVVATAGGGTVDTIDDGVTGFLAGIDDAAALAERLTKLLTDDALRARMADAGPEFVAGRFGLERMVDETAALYGEARVPTRRQDYKPVMTTSRSAFENSHR